MNALSQPLENHPASDWFPMSSAEELEALKRSIAECGLLEPIVIYDGKILDGRNRYKACSELGVEVRSVEYCGDSPLQFAWAKNLTRRHLTHSQRILLAAEMLPQFEAEAKKRQGQRNDLNIPVVLRGSEAVEQAAAVVGVSASSVTRAKAVKKANPKLAEKIKAGQMTVNGAYNIVSGKHGINTKQKLKLSSEERARQIRNLANEGHRASQIADVLHIGIEQIKNVAKRHGIKLPDASLGRVHHSSLDPHYLISTTTDSIEALAAGLRLVLGDEKRLINFGHVISSTEAADWAMRLSESLKVLNRLHRSLHRRSTQ
jgi:ParB-like nuclease domain